jgi:non-specific protein-tyrosine kinase
VHTLAAPKKSSPIVPVAVILLGGLVLGLLGAIVADRLDHTIRNAKVAAKAFRAPVLCTIPAARRGNGALTVLREPGSARSEAFRALAATSVATDRLPRAIMVSTPQGDVHEDVAANFAAALAALGLRVALVATSPDQGWIMTPFVDPPKGSTNLPELLQLAHAGRLNGQVQEHLPVTELSPNLVAIPPGNQEGLTLPFDGLPPLLDSLVRAGIDVAVIAGPALLENADATIVAWATRAVLWAVQSGGVTEQDAALAAARLELAGVEAFGVALVGEES